MRRLFSILTALVIIISTASSQTYTIRGVVFDSSRYNPMPYVNVFSTSGNSTFTTTDGSYKIDVGEKDSIWFSYLGKATVKYPVLTISNPAEFDISLHVNIPVLKEVKVRPRNYRQDSIQNRLDYAKIFDYEKPGLKTVTPSYGTGMGFDLDEIINVFRFRRNRSMASFQQRLFQQEQDKFVDHRFSKALVRRLTSLDGDSLTRFMQLYRPSFIFTKLAGDYDFQLYIKNSFERFKRGLQPQSMFFTEEQQ